MTLDNESKVSSGHGGRRPGAGRPKGSGNVIGTQLREMILQALEEKGGVDYLAEQAEKNPGAFLTLIGKILPTTITGDSENPVRVEYGWIE